MSQQRLFLLWHRYMGITVALFAVMLVITGWLINHTEALRMDSRHVQADFILDWYGIQAPEQVKSYAVGEHWISQLGDQLYLDGRSLPNHHTQLIGAVKFADMLVVALKDEMVLLTPDGRLIERLGSVAGIPTDIQGIALGPDDTLLIKGAEGQYRTDTQLLEWHKSSVPDPEWVQPDPTPERLRDQLIETYRGSILPWERVLLDLHSGRIFGWWGQWLIDFAALLILALAITGSWIWWKYRR